MFDAEDDLTRSFGIWAAVLMLFGSLLSGPVAMVIVARVAPQPQWVSAAVFIEHYRPIQLLPYVLGFFLVAGSLMNVIAVRRLDARDSPTSDLALVLASVFATFIFSNYVLQTTFVPALVAQRRSELDPLLIASTMSNPNGLCWALEMWGYAFLGAATWLLARVLRRRPHGRALASLYVTNGVMSIAGGVATAVRLDWVFSPAGLACFFLWNVVFAAMALMTWLSWSRSARDRQRPRLHLHVDARVS